MVDLLQDLSPIQIGTSGVFNGKGFRVIGRQRLSWDAGFWNEWYLRFDDGGAGWLTDAQGFYAVAHEVSGATLPAVSGLKPDQQVNLNGRLYTVDDIKTASVSLIEGYAPSTLNATTTSVDFSAEDNGFASIDYGVGKLYVGEYVEFDLLKLENLRPETNTTSTFKFTVTCPECRSEIKMHGGPETVVASCAKCSGLLDVSKAGAPIVNRWKQRQKTVFAIPLGKKGRLHGVEWTVIGRLERGDGVYHWREYLLHNRLHGYRWLAEYNGHWTFIQMTKRKPKLAVASSMLSSDRSTAVFEGRTYHLFNRGTAKVRELSGEFYWQIRVGEQVVMDEFVHPPYILSAERSAGETVWSHGETIDAVDIQSAFELSTIPQQIGIGATETSVFTKSADATVKSWGLFVALIVLMQIVHLMGAKNERIYSSNFNVSSTSHTFVTPSFELGEGAKNVEITIGAPVNNNWLEVQGELVNDRTGTAYEYSQGVEYYFGSDSDGPWTEGSRVSDIDLSSIPGGTYHLNLDASGPALASPIDMNVTVDRDVRTWSNFWWAIVLVSLYPILVWWRNRTFEVDRWSNSDFSPFPVHGDDE